MRVRLRPGTHFVPAPDGVHCARPGETFLLSGPPALYRLIDDRLGDLFDGTEVDELVAASASPSRDRLRPVWQALVSALLDRGALFTVDNAPDPATAARFADVLAYAEEHCPDPYAAFAALRRTRVRVAGTGPAADSARRGLRAAGLHIDGPCTDGPCTDDAPADLVVVVGDPAHAIPPAGPLLPVLCHPGSAVVGPVLPGPDALPPVLAAAARVAQWQHTHPGSAAPAPVGAVLAGSLAARRVLDHLLRPGLPGADHLVVVHGPAADTTEIPLPGDGAATLTTPWRGRAWPLPDPAPRLPLRVRALQPVDGSPAVYGWAGTDAAAAYDVLLALLRAGAGQNQPPGRVGAAGRDEDRWRLDGALRLLGAGLLRHDPGTPAGAGLLGPAARAVEATLREYFGRPVRLRLRRAAGLDWVLATAHDAEGAVEAPLAAEWGPDPAAALHAVLMAALVGLHLHREPGGGTPDGGTPGTWAVAQSSDAAVAAGLSGMSTALAGRRITGVRHRTDPAIGELPLVSGPIWLE